MGAKTDFIFIVKADAPSEIKIQHIKFAEKTFQITKSTSLILNSYSSWGIPSRFKITSSEQIEFVNIFFQVSGNYPRPIKNFYYKEDNELLYDFKSLPDADRCNFRLLTLNPSKEYTIKFSCYMLQHSDK